MPRTKATACVVYPRVLAKGENRANIGIWISELTTEEQLQALGPKGLKRISSGYAIEVDVPVTSPIQAKQRALTLAFVVQEVIHRELRQNFFIRKGPLDSNDHVRRALS